MSFCEIANHTIQVNGNTVYNGESSLKLNDFLFEAYKELAIKYPKFHKMDSVSKLGILTASLLFKQEETAHEALTTGIIIASNSGCFVTDENYIKAIQEDPENSYPALFTYTLPSIVMGEISIKENIQGENLYLLSDSFDRPFLQQMAAIMMQQKGMKKCLIGWIEVTDNTNYKSYLELITA
ncbi:3-oxoacyl-ACP synthase [Flavobacteriaceae bacterium]|nr:3-oxoacyl-ACP synthase [Flavobacteriaceae bacterium]